MTTFTQDAVAKKDRPLTRDVAVASRHLLHRLTVSLESYTKRCLAEFAAKSRWGTPPVFFFHDLDQKAKPHDVSPALAEQRRLLAEQVEDYLSLLYGSLDCRRMARAWPGFWKVVTNLALLDPLGQRLADTLALADDLVLQVILPQRNQGLRVRVQGVRDMGELLRLVLEGLKSHEIRRNYLGEWQFYRPSILKQTQEFPAGIEAHAHWFWGTERLNTIPLDAQGERSLILAPATVRTSSDPDREPVRVSRTVEVLHVLSRQEVQIWLSLHQSRLAQASWPQAA